MIIAVDFDGTLQISGQANIKLLAALKNKQKKGDVVILWTCREGSSLREAVLFLREHGFVPNFINSNCPEGIKRMGHDSRKVFADVYIDDKGAR